MLIMTVALVWAGAGCAATRGGPSTAANRDTPATTSGGAPPTAAVGSASGTGPATALGPLLLPGATPPGSTPPVVDNGPRTRALVALTFDADMTDGMLARLAADPHLSYANTAVVDILQRSGTPATFFLTGQWARRYPALTRRLAADPRFELGNHTWRHAAFRPGCYDLPVLPAAERTGDVARTFTEIAGFGGRQTRYFRFPGGCYDAGALRSLAPLGLTVIGWDVVSGDAFATAAAPIVREVLSRVRPGSIVVMHLTEANARYTDDALPAILAGLRAKGLTPVTVSDLLDQRRGPTGAA